MQSNDRLLNPRVADFEVMTVREGTAWRRGPPCRICEHTKGQYVTGAVVDLAIPTTEPCSTPGCAGHQQCVICGGEIQLHGDYAAPETGEVRILFPPETDSLKENPYLNPRPIGSQEKMSDEWFTLPLDDIGNGKRLALLHGHCIRYVTGWGWLVYDGRRWVRDDRGTVVRLAKHTVHTMSASVERAPVMDKREAKAFLDHAKSSGSAGKIKSMMEMAQSEPEIAMRVNDFDTHPWLLVCRNGIIDLMSGSLQPHDPQLYMTQMVNADFDPEAASPRWDQFLGEITLQNQELGSYLQRAVGYSLTGETREQCVFFLYGDGANGKSRFLEGIRFLMGDYATNLPFEAFVNSRNSKPQQDLAHLPGKRFVTAIEVGEGRSWNEGVLKSVSGGDMIRGEHKYEASFEFKPVAKFWLAANDRPVVHGSNEGIWRRFQMIPFQAYFAPKDRQDDLEAKLQEERNGILAWAVRGARIWYRQKLSPPDLVAKALDEYKTDNDVLARFIQERCALGADRVVSAATILKEFNLFNKESNERPMTHMALSLRLGKFRAGLLKKGRDGQGRTVWHGLEMARLYADDRQADAHRNDLTRY